MRLLSVLSFLFLIFALRADAVPSVLNYAGQVSVDGEAFDGNGLFKFALVNAAGTTTYWSNDGASVDGSEPQASVAVPVNGGLYSILLGNTAIHRMSALDPSIFQQYSDAKLRVWFSDGVNGFQKLTPDRPFASVPYALTAGDVSDSSISLNSLSQEVLNALKVTPSISTQPFARYDWRTDSTTIEARGRGHNLSYQWLKNGQVISGANAPVLELSNPVLDDNATYSVQLTNSVGQTTSQTITLRQAIGAPGFPLAEANGTQVPRNGLVLWLDAEDLNADGHADNLPNGHRISSWSDKITDKNATQTEWDKQPVKTTEGVTFDGSNDLFNITDLNISAKYIFAVIKSSDKFSFNLLKSESSLITINNLGSIVNYHSSHFSNGIGGSAVVSRRDNFLPVNQICVVTLTAGENGESNDLFESLEIGHGLDGSLSEILFYDRLLQNNERAAVEQYLADKWNVNFYQDIYSSEPQSGLVAYYKCEPLSGWRNTLWDYSGNERHLTMVNFDENRWADGVVDSSLAFDGLNDKVNSSHGAFNFNLKTVAFWSKPDTAVNGREDPNYVFKLEMPGSEEDYGFAFNHALQGGSGHWIILKNQHTVETSANFNQTFKGWFHVTMVATQSDGEPSYDFYANGNKLDTISTEPNTGFLKSSQSLYLGCYDSSYYKGSLDEFRIYDRILTPAEIEALYYSYQNPIIRTSGEHNATVGTNFSLSLAADNGPTTYLAEGLPAGLSLNVSTGQISGTVSQPGYHRVFVKAMNEHGTGSDTIAIVSRPQTDQYGWPVDVPDGSAIPQNGLVLWLDANDVDADGEFDSGTDHLKLANWADKAGKDHNATQASAFHQPTLRGGQIPERPALNLAVFDGNQSLAFPTINHCRTLFWVMNKGHGFDARGSFIGKVGEASDRWADMQAGQYFYLHAQPSQIRNGLLRLGGLEVDITVGTEAQFEYRLQIACLRTSDVKAADLIGKQGHEDRYFTGNIGEMLIYDRALSDPEIETVEKYLGQKWGISISHDTTPSPSGNPPTYQVTPANDSVTTAHLTEQILKYLKPEITTQPQATNIYSDSNHTFSVSAEGKYLTYQWKKDGLNLAGETNATLVLTDANATQHDGNYSVVVSNDFGSVESGTFEQKIISWHPKLLDGLILWADASDSSTIVKNNTRVSNWADKSGQGNHFTQSTENNMPFFGVDKINDLNALSGDDTFMTTTNNPFGTSVSDAFVTMVVEVKNVADCSFINLRGGGDNFDERWGAGIVQSWNEILFDVSGVNPPYRLRTNVDWNASDQIIFGFYSSDSGNAQQIWKNGNLLIGDSNSEVSLTDGGIKIGNLNGLILGEVLIVNGEINTNERIASEGYLAHKWNLSAELPSNHNYYSNAP